MVGKSARVMMVTQSKTFIRSCIIVAVLSYLWWLFFPVAYIWGTSHGIVQTNLGALVALVEPKGFKLRDCKLKKDSQVGWVFRVDTWHPVPFNFGTTEPAFSRPYGLSMQNFGVWQWTLDKSDLAGPLWVRTTLKHTCAGDAYPRTTIAGPFKVQ